MKKNISNTLKTTTTNYELIKPGQDDFYNIAEFNQNMDIIDTNIKKIYDEKAPKNNANFTGTITINGDSAATINNIEIPSSELLNGWKIWKKNGYGDSVIACKIDKQVHLSGLLECGVKTQDTLIFTLPDELRPMCNILKNVSCYPYGIATIEIQPVGNVLVGSIEDGTLAISMGDISYLIL